MKQHITIEQLNELSKNQKDKLDVWFSRHPYTYTIRAVSKIGETGFENTDPLLTIGHMIEFLVEHGYQTNDYYIDDSFSSVITFGHRMESKETIEIGWTNYCGKSEELCDALWEVVKEVLQDEKKT